MDKINFNQFLGYETYPKIHRCHFCKEEYEPEDEHMHDICEIESIDKALSRKLEEE